MNFLLSINPNTFRFNKEAKIRDYIKIVNKFFKHRLIINAFVSIVNSQRKTVLISC